MEAEASASAGFGSRAPRTSAQRLAPSALHCHPGSRILRRMARNNRPTRRSFIRTAGAAAAATWATGPAILRAQSGEKLRIAMIGVGGRGTNHLTSLARIKQGGANIELVAVSDVYSRNQDRAAAKITGDVTELIVRLPQIERR